MDVVELLLIVGVLCAAAAVLLWLLHLMRKSSPKETPPVAPASLADDRDTSLSWPYPDEFEREHLRELEKIAEMKRHLLAGQSKTPE